MGTFLAEWGLAILIALAVLGVLIWAEWRDHRDGLYDDDPIGHAARETYTDDTETLRCIYCQRTIDWPMDSPYPSACLHCDRIAAYTASPTDRPELNLGTDWRTVGPYSIDRDRADY